MGVHGLSLGPFGAKLRCAFFLLQKIKKNDNMVQQKHKNVDFREKKSLRSYMPHTKVGKNKCSINIYSQLVNLIIYHDFILIFIKHILFGNFCKERLKNRKTTPA